MPSVVLTNLQSGTQQYSMFKAVDEPQPFYLMTYFL